MTQLTLTRILMVEDEADIQAVAQLALEALGGFTVRICSSGREAIQAAPAFNPDLILLDVMMPGMDGPSTLTALRALPRTAATPVIFMTAKVQPQELAEYKVLGVLDVIAKPFDPMTLSATITAIWSRYQPASVASAFQALSDSYLAQLPNKLAAIDAVWAALQDAWVAEDLRTIHRMVHSLNGAGATLGLSALSTAARTLEHSLVALDPAAPPDDTQRAQIGDLIAALRQAASVIDVSPPFLPPSGQPDAVAADARTPAPSAPPQPVAADAQAAHEHTGIGQLYRPRDYALASAQIMPKAFDQENRLIFLAGVEAELARDLAAQLGHFGYSVQIFDTLDQLEIERERGAPAAIITGTCALDPVHERPERLATIRDQYVPPPPCIVVAEEGDFATRLRAARAGAEAYFIRPVNIIALIDKLDMLTARYAPEPYRILIVDDEPELAHFYAATLRQAGMTTVVVTDPAGVLEPLLEFRPDMILMDMYMPDCNGLDLAAVIRQQEDYVSIPIVFLSAETNMDMQLEAMRQGGDDFMTKPIKPDHLISAVTSRVMRSRALRAFMVRDSLTGLFNHTTTKEHLEIELARARRHQGALAFAIIDIDNFKLVNDTYGHPTGDRVLKSVARLLRQRLRKSDIIGRYGGEEFAIVLADTDGPTAVTVLDEIRAGLAQIRQQAHGREFTVTFSCGIASFADYADAPRLTEAADKALYQAKHGGRNRVMLA